MDSKGFSHDQMFPKEYEIIVHMLNPNDEIELEKFFYRTWGECLQTLQHHRVAKGYEIVKYEINLQRVLF